MKDDDFTPRIGRGRNKDGKRAVKYGGRVLSAARLAGSKTGVVGRRFDGSRIGDANPHSNHGAGQRSHEAVERARILVAKLLGMSSGEIIFTSGATEANNLAIFGLQNLLKATGRARILVAAGEHHSVLAAAEQAAPGQVERIPLRSDGLVDLEALATALGADVGLVSVAASNHEIGTNQPIGEVARLVRASGALLHTDLAQAATWRRIDCSDFDLASLSAHKMGGPIGIGALAITRRLRRHLQARVHGGGQESGARSGTLSAPLCVAFGEAARIVASERDNYSQRVASLRDRLLDQLRSAGGVRLHGAPERLPGNINLAFDGVDGEALALRLRNEVAISTGSACSASSIEPSHVLTAIGLSPSEAQCAVRIGLGPRTSQYEVDRAAEAILSAVSALRAVRRRAA